MKNRIKKFGFGLCLAAAMTFSACGKSQERTEDGKAEAGQAAQENTIQKGRYAEEEAVFPKEINTVFDVKIKEDGAVLILYESAPASLYLAESRDKGKSWENKMEIGAGELPNGYRAADAALCADESILISAGEMAQELAYDKKPIGEYAYYKLKNENGKTVSQEVFLDLPNGGETNLEKGSGLGSFVISGENILYGTLDYGNGEALTESDLVCIDLTDGTRKWTKRTGIGTFRLEGDFLYLNQYERPENGDGRLIRKINAATGEPSGSLVFQKEIEGFENVDFDMEKQRMFYCTEDGIYFCDLEMTLKEQLVDGRLSVFSQEGYRISELHVIDDQTMFLFLTENYGGKSILLRYEYDPDMPSRPDKQLNVYSLKENEIIGKMVSDFRKTNPDVMVNYTIGMQEGGQSMTDAVNNLNTEIMAGNGPDVLVLNSLPWESYGEKGLLMDAGEEVSALLKSGELYENLFEPYQRDGAWYAVPISYKIPMAMGEDKQTEGIDSLESLCAAVESSDDIPAFGRNGQDLLRYTTSVYWNQVLQDDGSISREELGKLLERTKRMDEKLRGFEAVANERADYGEEDIFNSYFDVFQADNTLDSGRIRYHDFVMDAGYLSYMGSYIDTFSDGMHVNTVSRGVFSPMLAGISGKAKNPDTAKAFLSFMLSEKAQTAFAPDAYPVIPNLPVNKKAFADMKRQPSAETMEKLGKIPKILGIEFKWPDEEYFGILEGVTEGLSVPAMENNVICSAVMEQGFPYMKGEKPLDLAVNEIIQKLELYQAE